MRYALRSPCFAISSRICKIQHVRFLDNQLGIPGVSAPELFVFFHIPKTGGTTLEKIIQRAVPAEKIFLVNYYGPAKSSLLVRSSGQIATYLQQMSPARRQSIAFVIGHVPMDIDTLFDRPSRYFTIIREPVDRCLSNFFHLKMEANSPETAAHLPIYQRIKNMTLEQYLDSGIGLDSDNHQVRMLAGCPQLDAPWSEDGRPVAFPAVEPRHLAMAKRNIEERFLVAGTLEQFPQLTWYLKRVYGWPLHRCFYVKRRGNSSRPRIDEVSLQTRRRLEQSNQFDMELYDWVNSRFARQIAELQPQFGRQVRRFTRLNSMAQRAAALRHRMLRLLPGTSR
jgi:hypothetical protein